MPLAEKHIAKDNSTISEKLFVLKEFIGSFSRVAVSFSGGVDSTLLLVLCSRVLQGNVLALTVTSPLQSREDLKWAATISSTLGIRHKIVPVDILGDQKVARNFPNRCYYCKRRLLAAIFDAAAEEGIDVVFDGTNADDSFDYRPGLKALEELGVISPFVKFGITKKEIRQLSKQLDLPTWNLPSNACLASRISYYTPITGDLLDKIEKGEKFLRESGFITVRLRVYNHLACIEVGQPEIKSIFTEEKRNNILNGIKKIGFHAVAVDLEGYASGKLNRGIGELHRDRS